MSLGAMYRHEIDELNERLVAYRDCADIAQHHAFKFADALIEIAVRNGPRRYYDPVFECNDDYVTAARALGIL